MSLDAAPISYALAAVAFVVLAAVLSIGWRGRLAGALLIGASAVSALWALVSALAAGWSTALLPLAGFLEVARFVGWFAFLLALLPFREGRLRHGFGWWHGVVCVLPLLVGWIVESLAWLGWPSRTSIAWLALRVMFATLGLILVEQLFRNTPPQLRWGIKFLCLGLGAVFAFDLYVYAEAMLFRNVDVDAWAARGVVNALAVPLLAVAAARNKNWSVPLALSRNLVFHTAALLAVGIYLLVMGAAGYYIRYFGGTWGGALQAAFLAGVGVVLFALLFSGTVRARMKVLLSKHFASYRFDYREAWLRFTRTLAAGEPGARLEERAIDALAEIVDSPGGALWLASESGDFERVAHLNFGAIRGSEPAGGSLARFLTERQWVVNLDEWRAGRGTYGELQLPEWITGIEDSWGIVPLMLHEELVGFIVLARPRAEQVLDWELTDLLKVAGRQAAVYLGHLRAARQLLVARQFESFNRMSAFVIHDLKNLVAQLSLIVANAEKHRHNPAFQDDMLATIDNAVTKMNKLLLHLRSAPTPAEKPLAVDLGQVVRSAVADKSGMRPVPSIDVAMPGVCAAAHVERLQRVVGHLVQNAIEATPRDGRVWVRVDRQGSKAVIEVGDTGQGMSADFVRERLFKPFESTKKSGMGIGMYESRQYVREIGGDVEVESEENRGTRFRIVLPAVQTHRTQEAAA